VRQTENEAAELISKPEIGEFYTGSTCDEQAGYVLDEPISRATGEYWKWIDQ
jgi:hypothetical protein